MLRYSPKPRSEYGRLVNGNRYGPSESKLLELPEVWNLAYLSFPYERLTDHHDPLFTTHVRRSTQMRLDGSGLGLAEDPTTLVGSLLNLPAPRFLYLLEQSPALRYLPMFLNYGQEWLDSARTRARFCEWGAPPDDPVDHPLFHGSDLDAYAAIKWAMTRK